MEINKNERSFEFKAQINDLEMEDNRKNDDNKKENIKETGPNNDEKNIQNKSNGNEKVASKGYNIEYITRKYASYKVPQRLKNAGNYMRSIENEKIGGGFTSEMFDQRAIEEMNWELHTKINFSFNN